MKYEGMNSGGVRLNTNEERMKYYLLHDGEEIEFQSLESALTYSRFLTHEWAIQDEKGEIVFDWVDRTGP
jgi:hypothetical protein